MAEINSDFDPNRFPKIDHETERVTDPEKWTPLEVSYAHNIAQDQYGLQNMNDYQLHQAARYQTDHQHWLARKFIAMGMPENSPSVVKWLSKTPEHTYYSLRKKQMLGFHE